MTSSLPNDSRPSILVVDDSRVILKLLSKILTRDGYRVHTVVNGEMALASARSSPPDLLLLDVMMPGLSGYEVCEHLKADERTRAIPVIFLSALSEVTDKVKGLSLGAVDYVAKPFEPEEILVRVKLHLAMQDMRRRLEAQNLLLQQEIAERSRVEQDLQESEARYRTLFDSMPVGLYQTTPDGHFVAANPALADMLACPDEQYLLATSVAEFYVDAGQRGRWQTMLEREGVAHNFEGQMRRLDGQIIWARGSAHVVYDSLGQVRYYEGALEDITERKQAEFALRRYAGEQATLYAITTAAASLLDQQELLSTLLERILLALNCDAGWVSLPGPSLDDPPQLVAWRGVPEAFVQAEMTAPWRDCPCCDFWSCTLPGLRDGSLLASNGPQPEAIWLSHCPRLPATAWAEAGLQGHVGIPLSAGGQVLGFLHMAWPASRAYTDADRQLLTAIGREVGLALHNAQLYQAARQVDRLRVLNELDRALAATLDPDTIMEATLRHMAAALHAPAGAMIVLPSEASEAPEGAEDVRGGRAFRLVGEWVDLVWNHDMRHRLCVLRQRLQSSPGGVVLSGSEWIEIAGERALERGWGDSGLLVPLWEGDRMHVVMGLGGRPAEHAFTDEDRALARAAASRASQAIRNAQLYQASQKRAAYLATLNAVGVAAVSSLDTDLVLRQILDLTYKTLNAAGGSILLNNPQTGGLTFVLAMGKMLDLRGRHLASGQGIAGWVVQHGQSVRVDDVCQDERWYNGLDTIMGFETHALLCAPLRHRDKVAGVIEIVHGQVGAFSDENLELLEAIASVAAMAMENARLYVATRAHADRMVLLYQIGQAMVAALDSSMVIHVALNQVQRLFSSKLTAFLRPEPETGELYFAQVLTGVEQVEIPLRLPPGEGIAAWALEHNAAVLVEDVRLDPRFSDRLDQYLAGQSIGRAGEPTRTVMAVPLRSSERVVGVIEVASAAANAYSNDELNILQTIASTLTVALENARFYEDLKALLREREQTQAQLIRSERMAAVGRLVASLAHEINNPLQALRSGFHLLLNPQASPQKRQRYLEIANREVERLITIVERVLGFYRPASDQPAMVDINALLEDVLLLAGKQLEHSQVAVQSHLESLPRVEGLADQFKQVFLNIVLNAQQAMPEGGMLTVKSEWAPEAREVRIAFADTGVGISPTQMAHLFEPFFTTRVDGTGLGLTVSYSLVERHGGRIEVESEPGAGSTFTVVLPAARGEG
ncbi:MAG: GAF domain-containing protein [Thermoflexales bacterium]|nr:GAF domain-containing protein [Thermoflexales bacterium]